MRRAQGCGVNGGIPRLYVDVHVLQCVPPSNMNRDDAGAPKHAVYGGARRARVSSQAWKRATRMEFARLVPAEQLGLRTRRMSTVIAERLVERHRLTADDADRLAAAMLTALGVTTGRRTQETRYPLYFGSGQIDRAIDQLPASAAELAGLDDSRLAATLRQAPLAQALGERHALDVALFGRMVADIPSLGVDAATQVAHALSTHAVQAQFDFYTSVDDDITVASAQRAGMVGVAEFSSATLYRFASAAGHQLVDNLDGDVESAVTALSAFVSAFVRSMPSGGQSAFAHRTPAYLAAVALRVDQPVNLVSAFERPVVAHGDEGLAEQSAVRLAQEHLRAERLWGLVPVAVLATYPQPSHEGDDVARAFGEPLTFAEVVAEVSTQARRLLSTRQAPQ